MGVNNVSFDDAMVSKSAAGQYLRSAKVSAEEKGQLSAKWGSDFVNQALSVDSTKYEISDEDFNTAKENGKNAAKDSTGYDGEGGSTVSAVGSAVGAVGATACKVAGNGTTGAVIESTGIIGEKTAESWGSKGVKLGDIATVILAAATAAKYWISNHNKDEHEAGMHLMENELPEGQGSLNEAQELIDEASENVTDLTEEAEEKNQEANDTIEEKKTLFDFNRQQYEALKAKKDAGGELTQDEKSLMRSVAPKMQETGTEINTITEETSDEVGELNDEIGEYQDSFDESAETIAEVEGVTDFAEGFDEQSRTLMYVEGGAQTLNGVSAGIAAAKLTAKGWWNWAFAAVGYAAAASSGIAASQQFSWASDMSQEIDVREQTQDLGTETTEIYDEELDNYAANIDVVEDLELEVPEDLTAPTTVASDTADSGKSGDTSDSIMTAATKANEKDENNNDKKKDDEKN